MSGNDPNPFQAGRGVYNNLIFKKGIYDVIIRTETDSIIAYDDSQVGVYFLNGASSARGLETTTSGAPVITNISTPSGAGQALVATSATTAVWGEVPLAPLDAQYLLWPPGNKNPDDTDLTNAAVLSNSATTTISVSGANVQVDLNEPLGMTTSINVPTIMVDAKGRIIAIVNDQEELQTWTPVAGTGVDTINTATCRYSRYFNEITINVDIDFDTTNLAADPVVFDFTDLPLEPEAATTSMNTAILLDNTGAVLTRGFLFVDGTADTFFFSTGAAVPAGVNAGVRLIGSLTYTPA